MSGSRVVNDILWAERRLRELNRAIFGGDIPEPHPAFLLDPRTLPSDTGAGILQSLAEACIGHVFKTCPQLEIPFRRATISISSLGGTAGEFRAGDAAAVITIEASYAHQRNAVRTVLVHELCHLLMDHNSLNLRDPATDEPSTDLCAFIFGLGAIYLAGQDAVVAVGGHAGKVHFGYLSPDVTAWAYMRTAAQRGVSLADMSSALTPSYSERVMAAGQKAVSLLQRGEGTGWGTTDPRDVAVIVCENCGNPEAVTVIRPVTFVNCSGCGKGQAPLRTPLSEVQKARLALLGSVGGDYGKLDRLLAAERERDANLSESQQIERAEFRLMRDRGAHLLAPQGGVSAPGAGDRPGEPMSSLPGEERPDLVGFLVGVFLLSASGGGTLFQVFRFFERGELWLLFPVRGIPLPIPIIIITGAIAVASLKMVRHLPGRGKSPQTLSKASKPAQPRAKLGPLQRGAIAYGAAVFGVVFALMTYWAATSGSTQMLEQFLGGLALLAFGCPLALLCGAATWDVVTGGETTIPVVIMFWGVIPFPVVAGPLSMMGVGAWLILEGMTA